MMDPIPLTAAEFDAIYAEAVALFGPDDLDDEQWDREQALLDNDTD